MARTQEQILARFRAIADDDPIGFRREVLADAMTRDTLLAALPGQNVAADWEPCDTEAEARGYLAFAAGKILRHRGISASRSVDKLGEYAWLLGRDDVVQAMAQASYPQYGAPIVKAFADGMGWPFLDVVDAVDRAALERMARGEHCNPDGCTAGCGQ